MGSLEGKRIDIGVFPLTAAGSKANHDQWINTMKKFEAASGKYIDKEAAKNFVAEHLSNQQVVRDVGTDVAVDSLEEKTVVYNIFAVGDIEDKVTRTLDNKVLRVPGTLERKDCFSFCLTLDKGKDQHFSDDNREVYRTTDLNSLHLADCIGRGIPIKVCLDCLLIELCC